jgi:hypothetical protein
MAEACPTCGRDDQGCTVLDVGAFCRAPPSSPDVAGEAFHVHLDGCKQCEEQPFNLCPIGHVLLMQSGKRK